jgi:hypothetical protein
MAKKQTGLDDIFKRTEEAEAAGLDLSDLDNGVISSTGVGLREGEIAALDAIGRVLGEALGTEPVARNALIRIGARRLIAEYRAGRLDLLQYFVSPEKPKARLKLD